MQNPLISVVLPTYNRPEYLRIALEGVRAQATANIETIIQDNGSETNTALVVADFPDLNIRYYRNKTNIGQTRNIMEGLQRATGKYIALLADDDYWEAGFFSTLIPALEADRNCVVAFSNYHCVNERGETLPVTRKIQRYHGVHLLTEGYHEKLEEIATVYRSFNPVSGCILRNDPRYWQDMPADLLQGADVYISYLVARSGGLCFFSPRHLFKIRYHTMTLTRMSRNNLASKIAYDRACVRYWDDFLRDPPSRWKSYYLMRRGISTVAIIVSHLRLGQWRRAGYELASAVRNGFIGLRFPIFFLGYFFWIKYIGLDRKIIP